MNGAAPAVQDALLDHAYSSQLVGSPVAAQVAEQKSGGHTGVLVRFVRCGKRA
jgi:hypothetical protein